MRSIFGFLSALALSLMLSLGCGEGGGEGGSGGTAGTGGNGGSGGIGGTDLCEGVECNDDPFDCTVDACDPEDGMCDHSPAADGTMCILGCGFFVGCVTGICGSGVCREECENDTDCNDSNVCTTVDTCDPVYGFCDYTTAADGTPCGELAACIGGSCRPLECEVDADCSDYKDCTTNEICVGFGFCSEPSPVQDGSPCAGGLCESGECSLESSVLPCTEQGIRNAIAAGGGPYTFDCDGPTTVVTEAEIVIDNDVILDGEGNLTVDGDEGHRVFSVDLGVSAELRGFTVTKGSGDFGGGIWSQGTLTLTQSTVSGNSAQGDGGGIFNVGTLTLTQSTVSGNAATTWGGGIYNGGMLTLTNSTVSGNSAEDDGGGISNVIGGVTLTDSTVSGNTADWGGGGIYNEYGTATLINSTVSGNAATTRGGGIYNDIGTLTLTRSTVSENAFAEHGGGIFNWGTLTLTDSTVSGNAANYGGGIYTDRTATLRNSTVSGNTADYGGGISQFYTGTLTLINSTVSENLADTAAGISSARNVTLVNSTVIGTVHGYEFVPEPAPSFALIATIIDGLCTEEGEVTWVSNGNNLESPGDTCGLDQSTDQVNVSAEQLNLGPLQDNGGLTMTHALLPGSVAIDQIPAGDCVDVAGPLTTDQRGEPRPETGGTMCDVGAFEVQP